MRLGIIDAREWQTVFNLKTGHKVLTSDPTVNMVREIMARHPFPGDVEIAANAWVTDTALELIEQYDPQFAFISYGLPYFTFRYFSATSEEKQRIIKDVFREIKRLISCSGFTPVIVGTGRLVPLKGYIDFSHLDGLAIASNWTACYAGIHKPSQKDLDYIKSLPEIEKVVSKEELINLFMGTEGDGLRLPDYFTVAREGYTYKVPSITMRKPVNIPAHNVTIPVNTNLGNVDNITEIRSMIEKYLPQQKIALIVIEGIGEEEFPLSCVSCRNGLEWYHYEHGELQFFALTMGKHNFLAYPQGYKYYLEDTAEKPYPFSGYFRDIPSDTIGSQMGIKTIAIGSRSMFPHTTTGTDISVECFARNLYNQGLMAVIKNAKIS